ncbi:hypothetical protein, partial [Archangium sp.]|uniref:hypothetical protein n=1 Tax=Archangium sp. TaxID=1872627 RepID=UPI002EDA74C4
MQEQTMASQSIDMKTLLLLITMPLIAVASANQTPLVFGTENGTMWRCDRTDANSCATFNTASSPMNTTAMANGYIYTGMGNGVMWRCDPNNANASDTFNALKSSINVLILANAYIYAGLENGEMWRCDPDNANACAKLNTLGSPLKSLLRANGSIYAGLNNGEMWRCDPDNANGCAKLNSLTFPITSLVMTNGYVFATAGSLWRCDPNSTNACSVFDKFISIAQTATVAADGNIYVGLNRTSVYRCSPSTPNSCSNLMGNGNSLPVRALASADGYLYIGLGTSYNSSGAFYRCSLPTPTNPTTCEVLYNSGSAVTYAGNGSAVTQIAIPYDTTSLEPTYVGEDTACVWQNGYRNLICPPFVEYLDK